MVHQILCQNCQVPSHLTEKSKVFKWTEEFAAAFKALSPPILAFTDYSREFILDTDACDTGTGCVLSRIHEDGAEHVIAMEAEARKRLNCETRCELLVVVYFIQHFRPYLLGRHFVLHSDPWVSAVAVQLQGARGTTCLLVTEAGRIQFHHGT